MCKIFCLFFSLVTFHSFSSEFCWIDPPKISLTIMQPRLKAEWRALGDDVQKIDRWVEAYHGMEKGEIDARLSELKKITQAILGVQQKSQDLDNRTFFSEYHDLLQRKINYLNWVDRLSENDFREYTFCEDHAIPIKNLVNFDMHRNAFWGCFLLEVIDPCHRVLDGYYYKWDCLDSEPLNKQKTWKDFFVWLENVEIPADIPRRKYFSQEELNRCKVKVIDGRVVYDWDESAVPISLKGKEFIFIVDRKDQLFIYESSETNRHSSASLGFPVKAIGAIHLDQGKVIDLSLESGHYLPTLAENVRTLRVLSDMKILDDSIDLYYYYNLKKIQTTIGEFKKMISEIPGECLHRYFDF